MSDTLAVLDDEAVSAQQREFLLRLHIQKMKAQLKAEQQQWAKEQAQAQVQMQQQPAQASPPPMRQASPSQGRMDMPPGYPGMPGGLPPHAAHPSGYGSGGEGRAAVQLPPVPGPGGLARRNSGGMPSVNTIQLDAQLPVPQQRHQPTRAQHAAAPAGFAASGFAGAGAGGQTQRLARQLSGGRRGPSIPSRDAADGLHMAMEGFQLR